MSQKKGSVKILTIRGPTTGTREIMTPSTANALVKSPSVMVTIAISFFQHETEEG